MQRNSLKCKRKKQINFLTLYTKTNKAMTTDTLNHYEFIPKPAFPVVGKLYPDSIDWQKNKVDPYSLAGRHTGVCRSQAVSNKARHVPTDSTFNSLEKKRISI